MLDMIFTSALSYPILHFVSAVISETLQDIYGIHSPYLAWSLAFISSLHPFDLPSFARHLRLLQFSLCFSALCRTKFSFRPWPCPNLLFIYNFSTAPRFRSPVYSIQCSRGVRTTTDALSLMFSYLSFSHSLLSILHALVSVRIMYALFVTNKIPPRLLCTYDLPEQPKIVYI